MSSVAADDGSPLMEALTMGDSYTPLGARPTATVENSALRMPVFFSDAIGDTSGPSVVFFTAAAVIFVVVVVVSAAFVPPLLKSPSLFLLLPAVPPQQEQQLLQPKHQRRPTRPPAWPAVRPTRRASTAASATCRPP